MGRDDTPTFDASAKFLPMWPNVAMEVQMRALVADGDSCASNFTSAARLASLAGPRRGRGIDHVSLSVVYDTITTAGMRRCVLTKTRGAIGYHK